MRFGAISRRTAVVAVSVVVLGASISGSGLAASARPADEVPQQWRSYWVDSFRDSIYTPEKVDTLVADAEAINANVLIVQVGRWMDCFCNRSSFPRTHVAIDPDFDPLDDVIDKAHAAGIEVHAWVNATPMWNLATPPPDPDHVFNTHGSTASGADRWLNKRVDGAEVGGATLRTIDPANPAATDYVVDGIASIVREYDVDGINLDFIRYPDHNSVNYQSDWGYSEVSLQRFQEATGRTDVPESTDDEFSDWRREQVTNFVRKIYLTMYDLDREDALSVNGITYWYGPQTEGGWEATRTYSEVLQDWKAWLEEGIVDVNVAMNYKAETTVGDRIRMFDEWTETIADNQSGRLAVNGPALYLNTIENSVAQARRGLAPTAAGNRVAGWSGYSYATVSTVAGADPAQADAERDRLTAALTTGGSAGDPTGTEPLFAQPADVPELTWKTRPTTGNVTGALVTRDGRVLDQVPVSIENVRTGETVQRRTDGSGWFGFVDLDPGLWLVRIELPDGVVGKPLDAVRVREGGLAEADFGRFIDMPR